MLPAEKTTVETPRRCIDRIAAFTATAVAVCTAGDSAALHFSTARGAVVITLPLREFVRKCRTDRDHNGRPFPSHAELLGQKARMQAQCEEDAEAVPAHIPALRAPAPTGKVVHTGRRPAGLAVAAYEAAWETWRADPKLPIYIAAARHEVSASALYTHIRSQHGIEYAKIRTLLRQERMNHYQAAQSGLPLLKPNGRTL